MVVSGWSLALPLSERKNGLLILYVFNICDFSIIWNFSEKRVRSDSRLPG